MNYRLTDLNMKFIEYEKNKFINLYNVCEVQINEDGYITSFQANNGKEYLVDYENFKFSIDILKK